MLHGPSSSREEETFHMITAITQGVNAKISVQQWLYIETASIRKWHRSVDTPGTFVVCSGAVIDSLEPTGVLHDWYLIGLVTFRSVIKGLAYVLGRYVAHICLIRE